jgi:hypothetical protein
MYIYISLNDYIKSFTPHYTNIILNTVQCHDVSEAALFSSSSDYNVDTLYVDVTGDGWDRTQDILNTRPVRETLR